MTVAEFAEHMREELILHGWDITGDTRDARERLSQPWLTTHSVAAVGLPLLQRGVDELDGHAERTINGRLRVAGTNDVVLSLLAGKPSIELRPPEGEATLETDAAARVLLLWGRRPADPRRLRSEAGAEQLGRIRALLAGY